MAKDRERFIVRAAIGTIVVALAIVTTTAIAGWRQLRAAPAPSYAVGDKIDLPPATYSTAEQTLVLFVRESCAVCQAEASRMAAFVDRFTSSSAAVSSVVVTGSAQIDAERKFAARFKGASHRHVPFDALKVKTVPTVVLVDRQGTVLLAHEGRPKNYEIMEDLIRRITSR